MKISITFHKLYFLLTQLRMEAAAPAGHQQHCNHNYKISNIFTIVYNK